MNTLVDNYGDKIDYFNCSVKHREDIHNVKVFPSLIIYKNGQKVMEISLHNKINIIVRLVERFLNSSQSPSASQRTPTHLKRGDSNNNHPQALLLMEESVQ